MTQSCLNVIRASIDGTERKVLEDWLKGAGKFRDYQAAMNILNQALKAANIKKISTVLLNEMMDEIDLGKFKVDTNTLVSLLALIPEPQRSRMLTDDIVFKKIPKKDWSKFRDQKWVSVHSSFNPALVFAVHSFVLAKAMRSLEEKSPRFGREITASLMNEFNETEWQPAYRKAINKHWNARKTLAESFHDLTGEASEIDPDIVEAISKETLNGEIFDVGFEFYGGQVKDIRVIEAKLGQLARKLGLEMLGVYELDRIGQPEFFAVDVRGLISGIKSFVREIKMQYDQEIDVNKVIDSKMSPIDVKDQIDITNVASVYTGVHGWFEHPTDLGTGIQFNRTPILRS